MEHVVIVRYKFSLVFLIMSSLKSFTIYTYDNQGKLVSESIDFDGNGVADSVTNYRYQRIFESYDDGDGIVNHSKTYTYDDNGNLATESIDNNGDNVRDRINTYIYDANGNLTFIGNDNNGDGTDESHSRMLKAMDELWRYSGELYMPADFEKEAGIDVSQLLPAANEKIIAVMEEATLPIPGNLFMQSGGKEGKHTEHLGYILTELQYMQRTYPGAEW